MHCNQNKYGRLVALLVILLTQVYFAFQKNQLFKAIGNDPPPLQAL